MRALCTAVAKAYDVAPDFNSDVVQAWKTLAEWSDFDAIPLRRMFVVVEVDEDMPYATAHEMFADLDIGKFRVSRKNCVHPVWTVEQNINFRICHDILGHYSAHKAREIADFSWEGELNAARHHEKMLPAGPCQDALCTELLGQAAYRLTYEEFPRNKIAFL